MELRFRNWVDFCLNVNNVEAFDAQPLSCHKSRPQTETSSIRMSPCDPTGQRTFHHVTLFFFVTQMYICYNQIRDRMRTFYLNVALIPARHCSVVKKNNLNHNRQTLRESASNVVPYLTNSFEKNRRKKLFPHSTGYFLCAIVPGWSTLKHRPRGHQRTRTHQHSSLMTTTWRSSSFKHTRVFCLSRLHDQNDGIV